MPLHQPPGSTEAPEHCPRCGSAKSPTNLIWLGMGNYYVCDSCVEDTSLPYEERRYGQQ
jgi:hypothetical protein